MSFRLSHDSLKITNSAAARIAEVIWSTVCFLPDCTVFTLSQQWWYWSTLGPNDLKKITSNFQLVGEDVMEFIVMEKTKAVIYIIIPKRILPLASYYLSSYCTCQKEQLQLLAWGSCQNCTQFKNGMIIWINKQKRNMLIHVPLLNSPHPQWKRSNITL